MSGTRVKEEDLLKQSKVLLGQKNQTKKDAIVMKSFAPVQLSKKSSGTVKRKPENNNIMLLARNDGEMENSFTRNSVLFSTVKKEVLLSRVDADKGDSMDSSPEFKIPNIPSDEPINLSLKPTNKDIPINPRPTFSSDNSSKKFLTPSDYKLSHQVSITPIIRIDDEPDGASKDPLEVDDDEEAFLSNPTGKVKAKISRRDNLIHMCSFCGKSYSTQYLCNLHMKSKHAGNRKETCAVCGVKFVNVKAHKEKYHLLLDVDTCNLCGKVLIRTHQYLISNLFYIGCKVSLLSSLSSKTINKIERNKARVSGLWKSH